jgi:hypothetical protein
MMKKLRNKELHNILSLYTTNNETESVSLRTFTYLLKSVPLLPYGVVVVFSF